jgi:hypothetical protein
MTGQILHLARRVALPCAASVLLAATLGVEPLQARSTLQFVDVTSGGRNAYRVTGVTTVSNYRIGVAGPVDLLPLSTGPARRKASTRAISHYAAVKTPRMVGAGVDEVLPGYLQCVPYARQASGIQLYGDARTWWSQAAGRYGRGNTPRVGAVMAFRPYGKMVLGHVAMVSRVVDLRRVLLRHANWSPINGRRGQVEQDVMAVDVSRPGTGARCACGSIPSRSWAARIGQCRALSIRVAPWPPCTDWPPAAGPPIRSGRLSRRFQGGKGVGREEDARGLPLALP